MRKNLNKLATLALSGMMVMSMTVPAFAAKVEVPFKKTLHTDGNTYAPNVTFNFTVTPKTGKVMHNGTEFDGLKAEDGAVTVESVTFNKDLGLGTKDDQGAHFEQPVKIIVDEDKFKAGLGTYFFTLTENQDVYEGIRFSKAEYTIAVTRYDDNGTTKTATVIQREGKGTFPDAKPNEIQNNYGKHFPPETPDFPDPTPGHDPKKPDPKNDTTHDVTIKKRIIGKYADKTRSFKFNVTVYSQAEKNERYKVEELSKADAVTNTTSVDDKITKSFTVTQDSGIRIYGLTAHDLVKVTEEDGQTYVMTVEALNNADNSYITGLATTGYNTEFNVLKDEAKVDVKNTKDGVTPTGIVMNVAPYAMMLAVAGGLGVVFMNRKKEEE